jgi:hypothetical protein
MADLASDDSPHIHDLAIEKLDYMHASSIKIAQAPAMFSGDRESAGSRRAGDSTSSAEGTGGGKCVRA